MQAFLNMIQWCIWTRKNGSLFSHVALPSKVSSVKKGLCEKILCHHGYSAENLKQKLIVNSFIRFSSCVSSYNVVENLISTHKIKFYLSLCYKCLLSKTKKLLKTLDRQTRWAIFVPENPTTFLSLKISINSLTLKIVYFWCKVISISTILVWESE